MGSILQSHKIFGFLDFLDNFNQGGRLKMTASVDAINRGGCLKALDSVNQLTMVGKATVHVILIKRNLCTEAVAKNHHG